MKKAACILTFALAGTLSAQSLSTLHNVAASQFRIVKAPATKKALIIEAAVAGISAGLYLTDKPTADYFKPRAIGGSAITKNIMLYTPAAIYAVGLIGHSSYTRDTAIYAAVAAVDAEALAMVGKRLTNRISPNGTNTGGVFPSSHTSVAFAVASVIAHRSHNKWVKVAAYGSAAAIGVSTIAQNGHYPTDVFAGAALGYFTGRAF